MSTPSASPLSPLLDRRALILAGGALLTGCDAQDAPMTVDTIKPAPTERLTSSDGARIAYERWGSGPPVILVDGAFCSRRFGPTDKLAPLLARRFTVLAYDRRGRGESGDAAPYAVAREIDDLAALIAVAGGSADVFGLSSGGVLALEAAAQGVPMDRLAVYEAPYRVKPTTQRPPADYEAQLRTLVEAGDYGGAVKFYMTHVMQMPALMTAILPLTPNWKPLKASAPSLLHEAALMGDFSLPRDRLARIERSTLILAGDKSADMRDAAAALNAAIPGSASEILTGQSHDVSMPVLAPILDRFFGASPD